MAVCICCGIGILEALSCAPDIDRSLHVFLEMARLNLRKKEQLRIPSPGLVGDLIKNYPLP